MTVKKTRSVHLETGGKSLYGDLVIPNNACGVAVFSTGVSGARYATLETRLANRLHEFGIATLVMDLVSPEESDDRAVRSDTDLLASRLQAQTDWLDEQVATAGLDAVLCGVDTGAAAAVDFFTDGDHGARAMAVLNGRLDLTETSFSDIERPVLFFLNDSHSHLTECNRAAYDDANVQPRHKHFLHALNDDALSIVARWVSLQFSTTLTEPAASSLSDEQRKV